MKVKKTKAKIVFTLISAAAGAFLNISGAMADDYVGKDIDLEKLKTAKLSINYNAIHEHLQNNAILKNYHSAECITAIAVNERNTKTPHSVDLRTAIAADRYSKAFCNLANKDSALMILQDIAIERNEAHLKTQAELAKKYPDIQWKSKMRAYLETVI